jgi:hypothetical protein
MFMHNLSTWGVDSLWMDGASQDVIVREYGKKVPAAPSAIGIRTAGTRGDGRTNAVPNPEGRRFV